MNWLIYIGGWAISCALVATVIQFRPISFKAGDITAHEIFVFIYWTPVWIWICWRFIK